MKPIITGMKRLLTKQLDELNDFELVMAADSIENSSIELIMEVKYNDYVKHHKISYKVLVDGYGFYYGSYLDEARKEYNHYLKCVRGCQKILSDVPLVYRVKAMLPTSLGKIENNFDVKFIPMLHEVIKSAEESLENFESLPKTIISPTKEEYEAQIVIATYLIKVAEEKQNDTRKSIRK